MALRQQLSQKLEQRLSPQQIQLMKLLQVPTMELDQRIKQELEENPALEEGPDEMDEEYDNEDDEYNNDEDYDSDDDFDLLDLDDNQFLIADTIIGNLDESGYLNREVEAIVDDLAFSANLTVTEAEVELVLRLVQELDPAGIGARDLRECLILQIERKQDGNITLYTAKKILLDHFEEFTKKHYDKIQKKLEIGDQDLKEAIDAIIRLNPKPGGS